MGFDSPAGTTESPWARAFTAVALGEDNRPAQRWDRWLWAAMLGAFVVSAVVIVTLTMGPGSESVAAALRDAPGLTTASGTARFQMTMTLTADGVTVTPLQLEGAIDFEHKSSQLTLPARGRLVEELRQTGGLVYLASPFVELPAGAHWVAITTDDKKGNPQINQEFASTDPSSGLQFLSGVNDARVLDHLPIDGVDVTHYGFTLDLESLINQLGNSSGAFGSALDEVKSMVDLAHVPGEVWIDTEGRVRRFLIRIDASVSGKSVSAVEVLHFSNFDEPVTVDPPASNDTLPLSAVPDLLSRLAAGTQKLSPQ